MSPTEENTPAKNRVKFSMDLRIITFILLAVIAAMFLIWKPWSQVSSEDRTVSVTGEAKVAAEPDEFLFNPSYSFKNSDRDAALSALSKKSDEVVKKLKDLGVPENKIKTNTDNYDYRPYFPERPEQEDQTYTLRFTVSVNTKELAQKVQDYLVTTTPEGTVSPQPTFSDSKRKELESQARDEATQDARSKAEQSAKNLGFKVGKVKSVSDGSGFGTFPSVGRELADDTLEAKPSGLNVQPGENELYYSVTVVYYVR